MGYESIHVLYGGCVIGKRDLAFEVEGIDRDHALLCLQQGFTAVMLWLRGGKVGAPPCEANLIKFRPWCDPFW